jgi:hypothetical protein
VREGIADLSTFYCLRPGDRLHGRIDGVGEASLEIGPAH